MRIAVKQGPNKKSKMNRNPKYMRDQYHLPTLVTISCPQNCLLCSLPPSKATFIVAPVPPVSPAYTCYNRVYKTASHVVHHNQPNISPLCSHQHSNSQTNQVGLLKDYGPSNNVKLQTEKILHSMEQLDTCARPNIHGCKTRQWSNIQRN